MAKQFETYSMSDYSQAWLRYRRTRNQMLFVYLASGPVYFGLLFLMPVRWLVNESIGLAIVSLILNACTAVVFVVMYLRVRNWPCPRCGKPFYSYSERRGLGLFTRHCGHCGLLKYSS